MLSKNTVNPDDRTPTNNTPSNRDLSSLNISIFTYNNSLPFWDTVIRWYKNESNIEHKPVMVDHKGTEHLWRMWVQALCVWMKTLRFQWAGLGETSVTRWNKRNVHMVVFLSLCQCSSLNNNTLPQIDRDKGHSNDLWASILLILTVDKTKMDNRKIAKWMCRSLV